MKKFDIKLLLEKFKISLEKDSSKLEPNPKRDWTILFVIFCIFFVVSGIAHQIVYRHFLKVSNEEVVVAADNTKTISREDVEKIINTFDAREAEFQKILTDKPAYADPSR